MIKTPTLNSLFRDMRELVIPSYPVFILQLVKRFKIVENSLEQFLPSLKERVFLLKFDKSKYLVQVHQSLYSIIFPSVEDMAYLN